MLIRYRWIFATLIFLPVCGALTRAGEDPGNPEKDWSRRQHRILILGSSTANGAGATRYEMSWAGLLVRELAPAGYTVINRSINGSDTATSLARFDTDVTPFQPGYVILATSIVNEYIFTRREEALQSFVENTRALIRKVEAIGAVPVVVGPYPNNAFDRNMRTLMRMAYQQLEAEGVLVWDFFDASDDGFGRWLPGYSEDGLHPTDAGHRALFESIPISYFLSPASVNPPPAPRLGIRVWRFQGPSSCSDFLRLTLSRPATSWTAAFSLLMPSTQGINPLLETPGLSLRAAGRRLEMRASNRAVSTLPTEEGRRVHVAVTYNGERKLAVLYLNGLAAASMDELEASASTFRMAGQETVAGTEIHGLLLYRSPLPAEEVRAIMNGMPPSRSLEAYLPLNVSPYRQQLNQVPGALEVVACGDAWSVVPVSSASPSLAQ